MDRIGKFKNILFLDIETVSCVSNHQELTDVQKSLWAKKAASLGKIEPQEIAELFFNRAAIYAEFGKVIAIGLGYMTLNSSGEYVLRTQCISGHDEKSVLQRFKDLLEKKFRKENYVLCAHNGKEFDFPYLCRRMLVNQISLPQALDIAGKKSWEIMHLDTMEMWRFGDRKSFTSLDLLASLFNINSSKILMDGSEVNHFYYLENDLERISNYCVQDVIVTVQVYLKLNNSQTIRETNIIFV